MEDSTIISTFTKTLTSFCIHLQTSSQALKQSMASRPIPLDSASSTFIPSLNRRVSSATSDLNLLDSMSFGTISFEELLGHCSELYNKNQTDLTQLEDRFKQFGYIPEAEFDEENDEILGLKTPESKLIDSKYGFDFNSMSCGRSSVMKRLEHDPLLNESMSLWNLGLSDVCLATLASEDTEIAKIRTLQKTENYDTVKSFGLEEETPPATKDSAQLTSETTTEIKIFKDDYEKLPSFMKSLASWKDLNEAVSKMNSVLGSVKNTKEFNLFHQDKLTSLGLGPKVRSYLLMLVRMQRLVVETVDGSIVYRVL